MCSTGSSCIATDSSLGYVRNAYPYAATTCTGDESIKNSVIKKQDDDTSSWGR